MIENFTIQSFLISMVEKVEGWELEAEEREWFSFYSETVETKISEPAP